MSNLVSWKDANTNFVHVRTILIGHPYPNRFTCFSYYIYYLVKTI